MQKKIANLLFSTRLTAILFIVFAIAMATGTFLDASSETAPTPYSRELIYNAWWFEAILFLFVVNFIGNIGRYRLFRKEKLATLGLHLSFILIIVGAFITRYIGYEGIMSIREGATENTMLSDQTYLTVLVDGDFKIDGVTQRLHVKPKALRLSERLNNNFTVKTSYNKIPLKISYKNFISDAEEGLIPDENGSEYLKIVEAGDGNRHEHWVKEGEVASIHNIIFAINKHTPGAINISYSEADGYFLESPFEGSFLRMADQLQGQVVKDSIEPLHFRSLYQVADMQFVIPNTLEHGRLGLIKAKEIKPGLQDALILEVSSGNETKEVQLLGGKGTYPNPKIVELNGLKVYLSYASKVYNLPFSITLNDFIADKYPGTEAGYSAFKSKLTINNSETDFFDYDIYMNHVLDHKGYRFFQSGFDPDEKGTVISVNHDFWGTWVTYIGYFLLFLAMISTLFGKHTRFGELRKMLNKIKAKKAKLTLVGFLAISLSGFSQETPPHLIGYNAIVDSLIQVSAIPKEQAAKFGELVIQDNGRMKPVHTFASELLRKISRKTNFNGLDPNQVFISMTQYPRLWVEAKLIKLDWKNDSLKQAIDVPSDSRHISLVDLFDKEGNYKLAPYLDEASRKANPSSIEKGFIKAGENFYVLNQALSGSILKVFPIPNHSNNKWVSYPELQEDMFRGRDSLFTKNILPLYFEALENARKTNDYSAADNYLSGMINFQKKHGAEVIPSAQAVKAEILYNKVDIFNRLYKYFSLIGILMFIFIIAQIFKERKSLNMLIKACKYVIWGFFILMSLGLMARAYVSGHAPWSDAYESVIYVAWATVLFGLIFGRRSMLTIASTAFVAAIILWVAHQSWMDPAISNLQPVLDSYWLMIHVAIIVGSYGPFTLGMILGASALLLMILTTNKNKAKMKLNINELTVITEMSVTVGLIMLTIGNFLGGMWANESWGRYWGWDPKETWALISIMIYAFVIHMRLVPGLRGKWGFNLMAILAFSSIMMTYFGVNFYLTGLHSYASGDKPITPTFVYYTLIGVTVLGYFSYVKYKKFYK